MSHPFNTTPAGFFIKLSNLHEHMRNMPPFRSVLIDDGADLRTCVRWPVWQARGAGFRTFCYGAAAQEFKRQMSEPLP
jgi:hypothetical protein